MNEPDFEPSVLADEPEAVTVTPELVRAFSSVLKFCVSIKANQSLSDALIGRRLIALTWVVNPALIEGSPSLRELSKRMGFKSSSGMAAITGEATRHFGVKNRAQAHAWNRGNGKA